MWFAWFSVMYIQTCGSVLQASIKAARAKHSDAEGLIRLSPHKKLGALRAVYAKDKSYILSEDKKNPLRRVLEQEVPRPRQDHKLMKIACDKAFTKDQAREWRDKQIGQ